MRRIFFCAVNILVFFFSPAYTQQRKLDSLHAVNNLYQNEDSLKVAYLRGLFRAYHAAKNQQKFRLYADSAILIASRLPNKTSLALVYLRLGSAYFTTDKFQAIGYYRKGIDAAHAAGSMKTEGNCYLNLGALYEGIRDYPASLDAHEKALALYASLNDKDDMTSCYMNIANIYSGMQQHVKAMQYATRALKYFVAAGSHRGTGVACDVLGSTYLAATDAEIREMGIQPADRFRIAEETFAKGLTAAKNTDDNGLIASLYADFGRLNDLNNRNDLALQYYLTAQQVSSKDETDQEAYIDNLYMTGAFYLTKMKNQADGSKMLYQALALSGKIHRLGTQQDVLFALSNMHAGNKQYDSALYYYQRGVSIRDSILGREREQEITRKQLQLDFDLKERDYRETQQATNAKLAQQVLLAKQQEQEILVKKQQLELSNKEKSLQQLRFLQEQAELQRQKKEQQNQLVHDHVKAAYDKKILDKQIDFQRIQLVFNKRLVAFLAILAAIVLSVAGFVFYSRYKTIRLNRTISQQKQELEQLGKVKDKILSVVSHDLRAPLNNLVAFRAILDEGDISPGQLAKYIDQVKGTMDHTSSMMENLLNWSASQMQGFTVHAEKISLNEVLENVLQETAVAAQKKNITVLNRLNEVFNLYADKNMLQLVIRNLVSNAIKFTKSSGTIELMADRDADGRVAFLVKDNGVGLSPLSVARINADTTSAMESRSGTAREKGTGLGLMLSKHFAALMNGTLTVQSLEGVGSTFSLLLPAATMTVIQ